MMGTKARAFAPLCNRSIEDLVPASNFYRHLEAKLDLNQSHAGIYMVGSREHVVFTVASV
jgi:hypothetical protein